MNIDKRHLIAIVIGFVLLQVIVGAVFIKRLGVLQAQEQAWRVEVERSKQRIGELNDLIKATHAHNKALSQKIAVYTAEKDSLLKQVDDREVTLLQLKKYGQKTIDDYMALPIDERKAAFAKLIGR